MGDRPQKLNKIFSEIAKEIPFCRVAPSENLTLKPDGIHFNAKSYRIFGERYFEEYLKIMN